MIAVPTLVMHGDDDQVVPIADWAELTIKLLKRGTLAEGCQGGPVEEGNQVGLGSCWVAGPAGRRAISRSNVRASGGHFSERQCQSLTIRCTQLPPPAPTARAA